MPRSSITPLMKKALRASLSGDTDSVGKSTANALKHRGLWECDRKLTREGWLQAVASAPLKLQARKLGLPIVRVQKPSHALKPEIAAYGYFTKRGYLGSWCEGGPVLLLIRAAALDYLHEVNTFGSRSDACCRFTEAQLTIHLEKLDEICSVIATAELSKVIQNFNEIYSYSEISSHYPSLDDAKMLAIAQALTMPRLAKIAKAIGSDPYRFRSGWPDLTLANPDGGMIWGEVKTTDKFHRSQIDTISTMQSILPGQIMLVHVS